LSTTTVTLTYPQLELRDSIGFPPNTSPTHDKGAYVNGKYYVFFSDKTTSHCNLYSLDSRSHEWKLELPQWLGDDTGYLGNYLDRYVAAISVTGQAHLYNPQDQSARSMDVENLGQMEVHALAVAPDRNLIIGAPFINARFWTIDTKTGEGKDQGRG